MKLKFTKHFKILLVFIVILIAGVYARYGSRFTRQHDVPVEVQRIGRDFRNAKNQTKHEMQFNVTNMNDFLSLINNIEEEHDKSMNILRKQSGVGTFIYLVEIHKDYFNKIINTLRSYETETAKKEQSYRSSDFNVNLKDRLEINEALKKRYLYELEKSRQVLVSNRLESQLNSVQASIDSLQIAIKEQEYNTNHNLLYLTVNQVESGAKTILGFTAGFATRFLVSFIGLTIGLFVVLWLFNLVLRAMSMMGIQTSTGKVGKGGSYKYGSYKYGGSYGGYGSSKRKVKRVYKDKDGNKKEETSDKK